MAQTTLTVFGLAKGFVVQLTIQSPWLAMGLAGIGSLTTLGLLYIHRRFPPPQPAVENPGLLNLAVNAIRAALERNEAGQTDPEVMRVEGGSIVVDLVCHTEQSFLRFMEDFEKGKIKDKIEEEFGKIGNKEQLDVTITNLDEVQQNVSAIRLKDAVCLIEYMNQNERVKFRGTGFHYGDGWVMTVAHNFQDDGKDDKTSHSYLSEGKFRVLFHVKGKKEYKFPQRKRMAFVHRLNPAEDTDFKNKDIWMVKLGIQYGDGRNQDDYNDWEKEEKEKLDEMFPGNFGLAQVSADPKEEDDVYVVYYRDDNESKWVKEMKIRAITKDAVPILHLAKKAGGLPAGAAGCPVMLKEDRKYHLVGLHFSGDEDDKDGEAKALLWKNGTQPNIQKGVEIITNIGTYLACTWVAAIEKLPHHLKKSAMAQVENEKKALESTAKEYRLTFHLKNGEIFKGMQ